VDPEISGDLLEGHAIVTVAGDPHDVVTELAWIRPGHNDILPAHPPWASQLRCHLFTQQTRVINLFLGWTLLGWVGALAMAVAGVKTRAAE
jgi:hypothetical protein